MIMDERLEFADATSVGTPNSSTVNIGDIIDLSVARDIGDGSNLYLVVQVTTAITSGGSATVRFKLASDATTSIAVDGTQTEHATSDSIAVASLTAGYQLTMPIPMENPAYERYLAFQVEEDAGQALTAGNVNAFLTMHPPKWKSYADASN
jgi:hypothetical protein